MGAVTRHVSNTTHGRENATVHGKHSIPHPTPTGQAHNRATAVVQRETGRRVCEHHPHRHRATTGHTAAGNGGTA